MWDTPGTLTLGGWPTINVGMGAQSKLCPGVSTARFKGAIVCHALCDALRPLACIAMPTARHGGQGVKVRKSLHTFIYLGEVKPQTLALFDGIQCLIRPGWSASLCS